MKEWLKSHWMSIDALTPFKILNYPYLGVNRKEKNKVIQNIHMKLDIEKTLTFYEELLHLKLCLWKKYIVNLFEEVIVNEILALYIFTHIYECIW